MATSKPPKKSQKVLQKCVPLLLRGHRKNGTERGLNLWSLKDFLAPTPSVRQPLFETHSLLTDLSLPLAVHDGVEVFLRPSSVARTPAANCMPSSCFRSVCLPILDVLPWHLCEPECTKIAHRRSLAIFTADEGIAGNSAARTIFTHFLRRRNRGSPAVFFAEEIAHLGASKNRAIIGGAVKIAAAAAENRAILVHSGVNLNHAHASYLTTLAAKRHASRGPE